MPPALPTGTALLSFQAFPVWFLPANMVVVGLVAIGVWGGVVLLAVDRIPLLGEAVTGFMVVLLRLIDRVTDLFAWLPGAYPGMRIDGWQCVGLYALVLLIAGWLLERWNWARLGTILVSTVLLLSWAWKAHERNGMRRFIVYDQRDGLTCAVENGRLLTVFADTLDEWTRRKITQHERSIGAAAVDTVMRMPESLVLPGRSIRWLVGGQSSVDSATVRTVDLVIVADDAWFDPERINAWFHPPDGFVLASTVSAKRRTYLRRWCEAEGVPVHDVRSQGAYVR